MSLDIIRIISKKWCILFRQMINLTALNAWRIYQTFYGKNTYTWIKKYNFIVLSKNATRDGATKATRSRKNDTRYDPGNRLISFIETYNLHICKLYTQYDEKIPLKHVKDLMTIINFMVVVLQISIHTG